MPRLLFVITLPSFGGAQTHVLELIDGFRDRYDIHLATSAEGPLTDMARERDVPIHLLPSLRRQIHPLSDYLAIRECSRLIKELRPALVHAHSSKAGMVARVAARLCRVPAVYTAHGWAFSEGAPVAQRVMAWMSELTVAPISSKVICVSESDAELARQRGVLRNGALATILHGVSDHSAPLADVRREPPRLMMVARFSQQKDHATLVRAVATLRPRMPPFHVDLIGSGTEMDNIKAQARDLGLADTMNCLGDRADVQDLYAHAQIFVLSTNYEGLPLSILEAMRAGLPTIATAVNGIPEAVRHGETGFLVPRGDTQALAIAIGALVESPDLRARMGAAARERYVRAFTSSRMLAQIESVYDEAMGRVNAKH